MAETPSHRRRKGRDAFVPYEDPRDYNSYIRNVDCDDFLDG